MAPHQTQKMLREALVNRLMELVSDSKLMIPSHLTSVGLTLTGETASVTYSMSCEDLYTVKERRSLSDSKAKSATDGRAKKDGLLKTLKESSLSSRKSKDLRATRLG